MLDGRVYFAFVLAVWADLGGLRGCKVMMLDGRVYLASFLEI